MKLKYLLNEDSAEKVGITFIHTAEGLVDLLQLRCAETIKIIAKTEKYLYRGFNISYPTDYGFIVNPTLRQRKSRSGYNYHTLLMDNLPEWGQYPKRSKSIICSTNQSTAAGFGMNNFIAIPYDEAKFGICPKNDLQYSFKEIRKETNYDLGTFESSFNYVLRMYFPDAIDNLRTSYESLIKVLTKISKKEIPEQLKKTEYEFFFDKNIIEKFKTLFDPEKNNFKVGYYDNIPAGSNQEVWTESKCVLIENQWFFADGENIFNKLGLSL